MLLFGLWNLFLALLPLALARPLARRLERRSPSPGAGLVTAGLFCGWLLLLPNAPYLLTDVRHFVLDEPWTSLAARARHDAGALRLTGAWGLLFVGYGAVGVVAFTAATRPVERALRARSLSRRWARPFLCALVAHGVWLGLVPRFNSWDAVLRPLEVLGASAWVLTQPLTLACILGFGGVLWCLHGLLDAAWEGRRAARAGAVAPPPGRRVTSSAS